MLTALAAASIATSGAPTSEQAALVVAYGIIATFLVWGAVIAVEFAGDRVVAVVGGGYGDTSAQRHSTPSSRSGCSPSSMP